MIDLRKPAVAPATVFTGVADLPVTAGVKVCFVGKGRRRLVEL